VRTPCRDSRSSKTNTVSSWHCAALRGPCAHALRVSSALAGKSRARSRPRPGGRSRLVHGRSTLLAVTAPHAEITGRALAQPRGRPPRRDQAPYSEGVGELHAFCPERAKREFAPGRARIEPRGTGDGSVRTP
jgi:hypothetical protein